MLHFGNYSGVIITPIAGRIEEEGYLYRGALMVDQWIINVIRKGLSNDLKMPKNSQVGFDRNIILYSYNDHTFFSSVKTMSGDKRFNVFAMNESFPRPIVHQTNL